MELFSGILYAVLFASLAFISFQDFKYLNVSLLAYVVAFLTTSLISFIQIAFFFDLLQLFILNSILLALQLACIYLYLAVKSRKKIRLTDYLGTGDIFFWAILAVSFSLFNFIVFQLLSFLLILAGHFIVKMFIKKDKVPLAGYQAIFFAIFLVVDLFCSSFSRFTDFIEY